MSAGHATMSVDVGAFASDSNGSLDSYVVDESQMSRVGLSEDLSDVSCALTNPIAAGDSNGHTISAAQSLQSEREISSMPCPTTGFTEADRDRLKRIEESIAALNDRHVDTKSSGVPMVCFSFYLQ